MRIAIKGAGMKNFDFIPTYLKRTKKGIYLIFDFLNCKLNSMQNYGNKITVAFNLYMHIHV